MRLYPLWLSSIVLILPCLSAYCQNEDSCKYFFDFGYGEEPYCDSSLYYQGYFNYYLFDNANIKLNKTISNIEDKELYKDSNIILKFNDKSIFVKRNLPNHKFHKILLSTIYGMNISLILYNGYFLRVDNEPLYLFFIRPSEAGSSLTRYRGFIIDLRFFEPKITPLPTFQTSNSYKCLVQGSNNGIMDFVSFNIICKGEPEVHFFQYNNGCFIKDDTRYMTLTDVDGFLYKVDTLHSNW